LIEMHLEPFSTAARRRLNTAGADEAAQHSSFETEL
jgi:hypothetical protein